QRYTHTDTHTHTHTQNHTYRYTHKHTHTHTHTHTHKRKGLIFQFPTFQVPKYTAHAINSLAPFLSRIQEVPVLYSTGTRPPRWLITDTWKTEIEHSHTCTHPIDTHIPADKTGRADEPK